MARPGETLEQSGARGPHDSAASVPGLVLIFAAGQPAATVLPLKQGELELGRDDAALAGTPDPRMSRQHAKVLFDGGRFLVIDGGSRNGTTVDGERCAPHRRRECRRVLRLGESLFLPHPDVRTFQTLGVQLQAGRVLGPTMQQLLATVRQTAQLSSVLHITGPSGAGKEDVARAFHSAGASAEGRFVAVNCASIAETLAERLLFGARRGAFTGADADAEGYLQAADRGTLFLDEIAELGLAVQAKLLRVLESSEVLAVGATRPKTVQLRVCSATHRELRSEVAAGRLREDLYYRIAQPQVRVPPLYQRPEEISWLVQGAAQGVAAQLALHFSFVEAALLRPWPGNVRELIAATRSAAYAALASGSSRIELQHLGETAGTEFGEAAADAVEPARAVPRPEPAAIEEALRQAQGNVTAAARSLGVHRTQLRRWLANKPDATSDLDET